MSNYYDSSSVFEAAPAGNHGAILIKVVDIGTQEGEYMGEPTKRRQEIWTWELPLELREDGQPFIISKFYTASLGEKSNLFKDLTNWLGKAPKKDFTPDDVLGKPCQLSIVEREGTNKRVVAAVASLAKGITLPKEPHNPIVQFSLRPGKFNQEVFDSLSPKIQAMIAKSPEFLAAVSGTDSIQEPNTIQQVDDSEIPF